MKSGYYWARYSPKLDTWVMMCVAKDTIYNIGPAGEYDFGNVEEFMKRYPGVELVEIEKPKKNFS